jgi:ubiquinone/menaquinone biosynthesis C-methylase UbiE
MTLDSTLAYYHANAEAFFSETLGVDMLPLHERFLQSLPAGAHILDVGCGSGRDSAAFSARG